MRELFCPGDHPASASASAAHCGKTSQSQSGGLTPPGITAWSGIWAVTLGEAISEYGVTLDSELSSLLEGWVGRLDQTSFLSRIPTKGIRIWAAGYVEVDQHFDVIAEMLATVVRELGTQR